jgi:transcriptional regulator with PAS, ATPase and Fis domain
LVQSPLRAGILRFLAARPNESFDIEALMQAFGRMRLDVENCVGELVEFGVVRRLGGDPPKFIAGRPGQDPISRLLDKFLERRATVGIEETSPSVQRFREMIGRDEKMVAIFEWIRTAAKSDIAVLILGPTGSGKELVAQMIHELSRRGQERFQAVNCAALPDTLFESEIFGYEKGAFTGAHDRKPGRLELANGGTLLLDEIGDLSMVAQAKLLRVLEERRFERLGGNRSIHVDFRLISATNRPLDLFVREGRFREDLYYRINAFAIRLPSLRERSVDIPVLANRFLGRYCASNGLPLDAKQFSREAEDLLISYHWPGNIRELESTVSRAALSAPGRVIRAADIEFLHGRLPQPESEPSSGLSTLREAERVHIMRVLEAVEWNKLEAAKVLDISRGTLYRKIEEFGLEPEGATRARRARRAAG